MEQEGVQKERYPFALKILCRYITLFSNDTEWTKVAQTCDKRDNSQIKPLVTRINTYTYK